ncbi:MAG: hypothetical protein Q9209_004508 [Squamulea sp. 1 TL-2023]
MEGSIFQAEVVGDKQPEPFPHLWTHLSEQAMIHGNLPAVKSFHQRLGTDADDESKLAKDVVWTFSELHGQAERLAATLFGLGLRKGDNIAAFLDNRAEWALLCWASVRLDATFVPLNPRVIQSKDEVNHVLHVAKPRMVVVLDHNDARGFERVASSLVTEVSIRVVVTSTRNGLYNEWATLSTIMSLSMRAKGMDKDTEAGEAVGREHLPAPVNDPNQTMMVLFTSGTTSLPKASISTYQNILASAFACKAFRDLNPDSTNLQQLPVFHSWSICMTWAFWVSAATVVYPSRIFDARASFAAIERAECTHMPAVPSMIQALINHSSLSTAKLDSLYSIDLAGTLILPEIIAACMDKLEAPNSSTVYGMTEGSFLCASDMQELPYTRHNIPGIVPCGTAMPGGRVRVCKLGSREILKRGEIGELHIGGLQVTKGYLDRKSDDFYQEDGINWLVTGDQAQIDEKGLVYVLGRYKDLIIRGGENISPASIERCLGAILGISDAQVIGIPDEIAGEVPVAVVRKTAEIQLSNYQIQHTISGDLGKMYSPQYILELQEIGFADYPRTTSGKIKKGDLKTAVEQHLSQMYGNHHNANGNNVTSTVQTLFKFWSCVSGRSVDGISPDERAETFADSIMMMQFCNKVAKNLGKIIAVEDLAGDITIVNQAQVIDARPTVKRSNAEASRPGPPTAADMVHVNGDGDAAGLCQQKVESLLQPHGIRWGDVEDIVPTGQTVALFTRRTRLRNWNRRHAYHVPGASVDDLHWAVTTCLELHPTFRSMILDHGEAQPLYVVIRPSSRWHRLAIIKDHNLEVNNPEDLITFHFEDDNIDYAIPPGPLLKILLVHIRNRNAAGLIISCHHSTFDALSMSTFFEDLDTALYTRRPPKPHAEFKRFAESKYRYLESPNADTAVAFHVKKLKGYTSHRNALWPPQRAPQFFRGSDSQWTHIEGTPGKQNERQILDDEPQGVVGINGSVTLPCLGTLKSTHGITAIIIFKAALALLNVHRTGASQAFFGQAEAARVWPAPEGEPDPGLPNTMDIPGPTWEIVVNRIHVIRERLLLEWLGELQEKQALLTKYAQAPFQRIEEALKATSDPDTVLEHELHDLVFRRQCFNWLPPAYPQYKCLEEVQSLSRADIGLQWNFMHADAEKGVVKVNTAYDDCQMMVGEVQIAVDEVLQVARWIAEADWDNAKVGDCPLLGKECRHLRGDENGWAIE